MKTSPEAARVPRESLAWRARWIHVSIATLAVTTTIASAGADAGCNSRDCEADLASYCAVHSCATYAETIASRCFGCGAGRSYGTFSCDGYQIIACGNSDVGSLQYYAQTGKLVAVAFGGGAGGSGEPTYCAYGPSSYFDLPCAKSWGSTAGGGSVLCTVEPPSNSGASLLDGGTD
jgi:hypothetical protein